jgi:hypothetical protein
MEARKQRRAFLTLALAGAAAPLKAQESKSGVQGEACKAVADGAVAEWRRGARVRDIQDRAAYGQALVDRLGPEVVATIRDFTEAQAQKSFGAMKLDSRGLDAVKKLLWDTLDPRDFAVEVVEDAPTRLSYRVTRCHLADAWRSAKAQELGFAYSCAWDFGFCRGLNPGMKFTRTKTLMQGDDCCNHSYEVEPPGRQSAE